MTWLINPVGGAWFTGLVAVVLVALLWIAPRPRPTPRRLWTLRALRLLATLLLIAALLRPTLVRIKTQPLDASLLILADGSLSMGVEDSLAGESRWQAMRQQLADASAPLAALAEQWDVRAYQFGASVEEIAIAEGELALGDAPDEESTALGAALDEVLQRGGGERLLGIILLSDGAQRALPPRDLAPLVAARRLAAENVPLYAATFGQPDSGDRADLAIEDLVASDSAFVKTPTEVTGSLSVAGYPGQTLRVQLLWEDLASGEMNPVAASEIRTGPQSGLHPFRLEHTPTEPGEYKLTVQVAAADGELITTNNQRSTFITVRDGGVKVLYLVGAKRVGGTPGLEQRFIRSSLAASPDILVTRQVLDYRPLRRDLPPLDPQSPPDVVILDDLHSTALKTEAWRALAERVSSGMGLAMLGGHHSFGPGGYRTTPLADVLPVVIGPAENQRLDEPVRADVHVAGPLRIRPTEPLGAAHPILQIASGSKDIWAELPKLDGANRFERTRLKPNAIVLAEAADAARHPLLVVGQAGRGRVLAFAGDTTWRWRLEGFGEAHRRLWRQAVLWLARKDDSTQNPVWLDLASRRISRGATLDFDVGVRGGAGSNPGDVKLTLAVTVDTPDGETITLTTEEATQLAQRFSQTGTPGDYKITAVAREGDEEIGTATARFSVPEQDLELDRPAAEPSLMAQLAATTSAAGGRSIAPEELPRLLEELAELEPELEEEVVARITYWDTWPFFLLLVGLLGVEWYLRKRWGLV